MYGPKPVTHTSPVLAIALFVMACGVWWVALGFAFAVASTI